MADEERKEPLKEVDSSELGQLSPSHTPNNPKLQGHEMALGRGGDAKYGRIGQSLSQPMFTLEKSEDLNAAAQARSTDLRGAPQESSGIINEKELGYSKVKPEHSEAKNHQDFQDGLERPEVTKEQDKGVEHDR